MSLIMYIRQRMSHSFSMKSIRAILSFNEMKTEKQPIEDKHKSSNSDGSFELRTHHQGRQDAMIGIITVHTVDI